MLSLSFSPVKMRSRHSQIRVDLVLVKGLSVRENMNQIYTSSVPVLRIALVKIVDFTRALKACCLPLKDRGTEKGLFEHVSSVNLAVSGHSIPPLWIPPLCNIRSTEG